MFFLADTFLKVDKIYRARRFVFMHYFHSVLSGHSAILSSDSLELHFVLVHCCPSLTSFLMPDYTFESMIYCSKHLPNLAGGLEPIGNSEIF